MSEDKSDKKLPVRYHKTETAPTPDRSACIRRCTRKRFSAAWSVRFVARLNKHTIERNTEEVEARTKHAERRDRTRRSTLERDRTIEHYLTASRRYHRDDHEQHLDEMEANREARLDAREEREHKRQLRRANSGSRSSIRRRFASATTRFGLDVFNQTLPHRQEQLRAESQSRERSMLNSICSSSLKRWPNNGIRKKAPPKRSRRKPTHSSRCLRNVDHEIERVPQQE